MPKSSRTPLTPRDVLMDKRKITMAAPKRTLVFSRGPNQGYRTYTAEQIKAGMEAPKPQQYERRTFERPFGSIGTCAVHGSKAKTLVNGVCQACSHRGWNVKRIQDHLAESRKIKAAAVAVSSTKVGMV